MVEGEASMEVSPFLHPEDFRYNRLNGRAIFAGTAKETTWT
jgi:hypothetical protein